MTTRTLETWSPELSNKPDNNYYYHCATYIQSKIQEGKTELPIEETQNDGKNTIIRTWVDTESAEDFKTFLEAAATLNGVDTTVVIETI